MNTALAFLIAFLIGFFCRWLGVPLPAPPTVIGVLLIATITAGYLIADRIRPAAARPTEAAVTERPER